MMFYYDALKNLFFNIALITAFILYPIFSMAESSKPKTSVETLADLSIEQLMSIEVSSTSFFDIAPEKAPGSLYLVSQEQMKNSYSSSISDFLEYYVPGVNISRAYSAGSLYSARGIASLSNATTLFMVNGTNMNVSSGTGINTNLNLPLLGDIERIEVLKGPCSIIHGSGSINGFINVIQKNGKDNSGGFINTEVSFNDGLLKTETGYGGSSPEYGDIFLYAGGVKSDGINETGKVRVIGSNQNPSTIENSDTSQSSINDNYFPDINTRFSLNWNKDNFSLIGLVQNEKVESTLPGQTSTTSAFQNSGTSSSNKQVAMKNMALLPQMNLDLTDTEKLTIGLPVQYFEYDPDPAYFSTTSEIDSELHLKSNFIFKTTRFSNHRIALGASAFFKQFSSDRLSIYIPYIVEEGGDKIIDAKADLEWFETSMFFEDNYQLTENLNLFAGIRYDSVKNSSFNFTSLESFTIDYEDQIKNIQTGENGVDTDVYSIDALIPRLGITYDIDENKIVKFVYQQGYHYPDYITVMKSINYFWGDEPFNKQPANEPVVAEEVESYELSYYQDFMDHKFQFNLSLYSNIFNNTVYVLVDEDLDGTSDTQIDDKFVSTGFETSLKFNPDSSTSMEISYSFSQPSSLEDDIQINPYLVDESGDHWKAFPEHTIKANMSKSFINEKLDISFGCLFNTAINTLGNNFIQGESSSTDMFNHDRFVFNAGARYHLTSNCSITVKGENIFDNDVPAAGYYYKLHNSEGISLENPTYTIGLSWKF